MRSLTFLEIGCGLAMCLFACPFSPNVPGFHQRNSTSKAPNNERTHRCPTDPDFATNISAIGRASLDFSQGGTSSDESSTVVEVDTGARTADQTVSNVPAAETCDRDHRRRSTWPLQMPPRVFPSFLHRNLWTSGEESIYDFRASSRPEKTKAWMKPVQMFSWQSCGSN